MFGMSRGSVSNIVCWLFWCSNGCATSEDILWKLEALQTFVAELRWPDEVFAEHIGERLKMMSHEMVEAAAKRCVHAFVLSFYFTDHRQYKQNNTKDTRTESVL